MRMQKWEAKNSRKRRGGGGMAEKAGKMRPGRGVGNERKRRVGRNFWD